MLTAAERSKLTTMVGELRAAASAARHRRALVVSGETGWTRWRGAHILETAGDSVRLWIGDHAPPGIETTPAAGATAWLGRELDLVVYDAWDGLDPDALGAISGALTAGGLLVLLCPALNEWPDYPDPDYHRLRPAGTSAQSVEGRFLRRLVTLLASDPAVVMLAQGRPYPRIPQPARKAYLPEPVADEPCLTLDQSRAVTAICRVATGHPRRPVVLISDRGRGKSAALGIAAARLMKESRRHIVVTAPRPAAVEAVLFHAANLLPGAERRRGEVAIGPSHLTYAAPDELLRQPANTPVSLLLVDEAAAIPAPLLQALLARYPRIAFATTVHGYEGTGRGFDIRFRALLQARTPRWRQITLEKPIRWASGDPLEKFIFRALVLDADLPALPAQPIEQTARIERLDRDRLAANETRLKAVFGLLVSAHYRTRPFDLRMMLDAPNISVWTTSCQGHTVATALVAEEGGLPGDTCRRIVAGAARPQGHLLAETLAAHSGLREAPALRCLRILRIVVHPQVRRLGIGTGLIKAITASAAAAGLDYIGSSFAASDDLFDFWTRAGLWPVRYSVTRGHASGAHSVVVLAGLSQAGQGLFAAARERFSRQLPVQLGDSLRAIPPTHVLWMLETGGLRAPSLTPADWDDAIHFAWGRRLYEASPAALRDLALLALSDPALVKRLPVAARHTLIGKVLQHRSWQETAALAGFDGRRQTVALLREAYAQILWALGRRPPAKSP